MGQISLYAKLYKEVNLQQPIVTKSPEEVYPGVPLLEDARPITLAEYDVQTKDVITAHRIKDYIIQHMPLPYSKDFRFGEIITSKVKALDYSIEKEIRIGIE